ncbi:MAG: hypothetical protein AB1442_13935, partial [Nitrospirota bacterium]
RVLRCPACGMHRMVPLTEAVHRCECGTPFVDVLIPVLDKGKMMIKTEPASRLRKFVMENVKSLSLG